MEYKVGDKVKIKTWDSLVYEYGTEPQTMRSIISTVPLYSARMENSLICSSSDRAVIIREIFPHAFKTEETLECFPYSIIEYKVFEKEEEKKPDDLIDNRFELLDIR